MNFSPEPGRKTSTSHRRTIGARFRAKSSAASPRDGRPRARHAAQCLKIRFREAALQQSVRRQRRLWADLTITS
jgi:hypothetical protein